MLSQLPIFLGLFIIVALWRRQRLIPVAVFTLVVSVLPIVGLAIVVLVLPTAGWALLLSVVAGCVLGLARVLYHRRDQQRYGG
jgi:hypothetical protein